MATRMEQRRGTAAEWASANPILAAGEFGVTTDTKVIKFGDGTTRWNDLASGYMRKGGAESVSESAGQNTAYVTNLNLALRSGWYNVNGATGAPDSGNWWLVMVITHVYSGGYQRQIAYDMTGATGRIMSRYCAGGDPTLPASWTAWVNTNLQQLDLSSVIPKSIVDASGDILIGTGADTVGILPQGAPGQQLKVKPDGSGLFWETPQSTDLSSRIPLSLIDAAGDLIVGQADNVAGRLAVGSVGQILMVVGAGTLGWFTIPAYARTDLGTKVTFAGPIGASAVYDGANRVYSASNPPPNSGGAVINQTLRGQLTVTQSAGSSSPSEPAYQDFTIPAVNMAKAQLRYLGGGSLAVYTGGTVNFPMMANVQLLNSTTVRVTTALNLSGGTYTRASTSNPLSYEITEWA